MTRNQRGAPTIAGGNSKLGPLLHSWSITPIDSCPGRSYLCSRFCYARRGNFGWPAVQKQHYQNYLFSQTTDFVSRMVVEIKRLFVRVLRIHTGGDYYDAPYIEKWIDIVKAHPDVRFFSYTRSWRQVELLPGLLHLGRLPNFDLWWSVDRETGPAPMIPGIRTAYMAIDDVDAQQAPSEADLIFRDKPKTPMKRGNGILVCPVENKVPGQHTHTCSTCQLCWTSHTPNWELHTRREPCSSYPENTESRLSSATT